MGFPARLPIPDAVLRIAKQLEGAGYETWCVGGAIRDNLLGVENHDFDLTTAAPPGEVQRLFKRTVPVGIEHGTVAVLDQQNRQHEVTTFRKDIKTDGRHAVVEFGVSLMDDLARRDFTINAIAYHPIRHEWRDPFHGADDLEHKLIRSVGDANWRFQEDYLRILRALRFSARFEFRIQPRTLEAAKANVQGLAQLSAERVRDEWFKGIATAKRVSKLLTLWIDVGAARIWLPEIPGGGKRETGNVDKLPRDAVLVTAYLASDPASLLTRLKSSNKDIERARAIGQWRDKYPDPRHLPEVRKWLSQVGEYADDLLALLPGLAVSRFPFPVSRLPKVVAAVRAAKDPLTVKDLAVKGDDLLAAGVRPGPQVGETLERLLAEVLEDPSRNTRDYLLSRV
ncbi:MAG: polynucleotide adenylyltransferase [Gemmatimonadetes bacterium]|nr:MAG: polynucleotide adenylyltransferase [Gemmatimonadota bacterium]PYP03804.1 MAG: polynucleotide adenylyltransferase [Gemmatimonadota bacterium]